MAHLVDHPVVYLLELRAALSVLPRLLLQLAHRHFLQRATNSASDVFAQLRLPIATFFTNPD
jgi:hypothetical protein